MAKQPETRERYRIHGEVPMEDFGFLLAQLTKLGLQNIGYELITEVDNFKVRKTHQTSAEEFTKQYMEANPSFKVADLIKAGESEGRTAGAAYTAVRVLSEKGVLRKLAPGHYQATAQKALPAPTKKAKETNTKSAPPEKVKLTRSKRGAAPRYEVSNKDFIFAYMRGRKKITALALTEHFKQNGRNVKSVSSLLTQFGHLGILKNEGQGLWAVTQRYKPKKPNTPAELNGPNGVEEEVMTTEQSNG